MIKGKNYITFLEEGEKKGFRYGSDMTIYTERFIDGRLVCAAYQDNGVPIRWDHESTDRPSFDLVIDGKSLYYGWKFEGFDNKKTDNGVVIGTVNLRHTVEPILLKIHTYCTGFGFYKRYLEITNTSKSKSISLTSIIPMSGSMWKMTCEGKKSDNIMENLRENTLSPYSIGRFVDNSHDNEGNFVWDDIPLNAELACFSMRGRSGFNCPFFILRNNIHGGYFLCHLGWSANWKAGFTMETYNKSEFNYGEIGGVHLNFYIMPVSPAPARMIDPGESIKSPEVHFGMRHGDLDDIVQNYHTYLRNSTLRIVGDGLQPVIFNNYGYMMPTPNHPDMSEDGLKAFVDIAVEIGAELFMVDAGWFSNKGKEWRLTVGDWHSGDCLPNDLFPVFDYARQHGLKCGLWMEAESAGRESKLAKEHPDWFIMRYGKTVERILDLAKIEVRDYVESEIIRLIERYHLDMFRLDYNNDQSEGGFNRKGEIYENTLWRHMEAIYSIFDKVGKRFPNLLLENCSSGGGRIDVGMVSRFTNTWVSDSSKMPKTVRILNGISMALPPEFINRNFGVAQKASYCGNMDTQMHVIIMSHPTIVGITPSLAEANPELMECVKKYIKIFKEFIRTFHRTAKIYHHTPVIPGVDGSGWCALEYVSENQGKAVAGVFRLVNAEEDTYLIKFRGLNKNLSYKVQIEPGEEQFTVSGFDLSREGLEIRLDAALTSKLIMLTAV